MYAFVVTGRAGDQTWPAKVFTGNDEMPAKIYVDIATGVGNSCRENLKMFRESEIYGKLNLQERAACEEIMMVPISAMDPHAVVTGLYQPLVYTYQKVALHD